tara:strand:+ start:263 stop:577 length:315 start_codon:yes stop_codon:yes gene_type:complete
MTSLTSKDYTNILTYYKINATGKTKKEKQNIARKLLAKKLCKCIQKVEGKKIKTLRRKVNQKTRRKQNRAIGICRDAVIRRKGYRIKKFTCKKQAKIEELKKNK